MREYFVPESGFVTRYEGEILPYEEALRCDGTFSGFDGKPLHYASFTKDNARGTVVILHGFTENIEKYREMIYYFLRDGLNVLIYDQRGHGLSHRDVKSPALTHIRRFNDYVRDLDRLVGQVLPGVAAPYYLYSHSMGGGVAALYLETRPDHPFSKAVLSSPMIAPYCGGVSTFAARLLTGGASVIGLGKKRLFLSKTGPYEPWNDRAITSRQDAASWSYHADIRYSNDGPTYRWVLEALRLTGRLLRKGRVEAIGTPVLLFSAGADEMVLNAPQKEFADRLPAGEYVQIEGASHELYRTGDATLFPYVEKVLDFFTENADSDT